MLSPETLISPADYLRLLGNVQTGLKAPDTSFMLGQLLLPGHYGNLSHALLHACSLLGTQPARTLMVGDSSNDAQAARAAGCPVLLVRYGYNHGEPVESVDADAYADALDALRWAD